MCELSFRRDLQENAPKEEMVLVILDISVIEDVIEEETYLATLTLLQVRHYFHLTLQNIALFMSFDKFLNRDYLRLVK